MRQQLRHERSTKRLAESLERQSTAGRDTLSHRVIVLLTQALLRTHQPLLRTCRSYAKCVTLYKPPVYKKEWIKFKDLMLDSQNIHRKIQKIPTYVSFYFRRGKPDSPRYNIAGERRDFTCFLPAYLGLSKKFLTNRSSQNQKIFFSLDSLKWIVESWPRKYTGLLYNWWSFRARLIWQWKIKN